MQTKNKEKKKREKREKRKKKKRRKKRKRKRVEERKKKRKIVEEIKRKRKAWGIGGVEACGKAAGKVVARRHREMAEGVWGKCYWFGAGGVVLAGEAGCRWNGFCGIRMMLVR